MSRFKSTAEKSTADYNKYADKRVTNFMDGNSYTINPIDTLRIVAASSIFGEPSYYRSNGLGNKSYLEQHDIFADILYKDVKSTCDVFTNAIDSALAYDFKATLELAVKLRKEYYMRLNPAVIFIRAAKHSGRKQFNETNPGLMREIGKQLILRPDDITNQFEYYMFLNTTKGKLPSIVKRVWADSLSGLSRYHVAKYKSKSLIDLVRISHAHSEVIDELMKTGNVTTSETEKTWETLKSQGKNWKEILEVIKMPHMSALRNLRGIFTEINDVEIAKDFCEKLKNGVLYGKQFPFRYYTAFKEIEKTTINHKQLILDTLEECIDIAVANMPKLKGRTICLSDNSGSAWGALVSEYGTTQVAEIGNLSSLITAMNSDEGEVGVFGDRLNIKGVSKRNGILTQLKESCTRGKAQGGGTENGIWLFLDAAIKNKTHYDNIFIYSDMQAGHGGLYGIDASEYRNYTVRGSYIDVLKLVQDYRKIVNPKVNVFSVQTAGYNDSVIPENLYRGAILTGWTGKELTYASELVKIWDDIETRKQ